MGVMSGSSTGSDGGGAKNNYALGGQPSSIRTDVGDASRPNLEWCIQGHYPGTGWQARPNRYVKNPALTVLDVDGNSQSDALTDGLLMLRYLFGLRGSSLTAGAISSGASEPARKSSHTYSR